MTEGSDYGWSARGVRFGDQGANAAPDFARNDRGAVDDHWSRAIEQACGKCGADLTAGDFVRRRLDGTWVHESCPQLHTVDGAANQNDGNADTDHRPT